jgi:hypothetical protein
MAYSICEYLSLVNIAYLQLQVNLLGARLWSISAAQHAHSGTFGTGVTQFRIGLTQKWSLHVWRLCEHCTFARDLVLYRPLTLEYNSTYF